MPFQYDRNLKKNANDKLSTAMGKLNGIKSFQIDIPSDFEGAGLIQRILDIINNISIGGIIERFESATEEAEAQERQSEKNASGFVFRGGMSFGSNYATRGEIDWRNEMEQEKKVRHRYAIEAKTKKEWLDGILEDHDYVLKHPGIYRYGNSGTFPPCEWEIGLDGKPIKYTSCNRLVSRQLYEWGYTEMGRRR